MWTLASAHRQLAPVQDPGPDLVLGVGAALTRTPLVTLAARRSSPTTCLAPRKLLSTPY
jgi:hypothetical protein